jgi:hypothetical protein
LTLSSHRNSINCNVRFHSLTAALIGCAAAFGAASDDTDGAGRPPWRVYKVAPLTWTDANNFETQLPNGTVCHTRATLTASSDPFFVGTPATKKITSFNVRAARTRNAFVYGKRAKWPFLVPARMTLVVGENMCDGPGDPGSCAGTYHSVGGVLGYIQWFGAEHPGEVSGLDWSHKIDAADKRPPMTCGPTIGEPVYEVFFGGRYLPGGGGTLSRGKGVPLSRKRLVAGHRFTSTRSGEGDVQTLVTRATFTPVRPPG